MSDGNFNRQLLPKTDIASSIRIGKAQMCAKAEKAFEAFLEDEFSGMSAEQKKTKLEKFMNMLRT